MKRFSNWCLYTHGHGMLETANGNWVTIADHEAAMREAMRLLRGAWNFVDHDGFSDEIAVFLATHTPEAVSYAQSPPTVKPCEHDFQQYAINNAKSPLDPPEMAYTPYKCIKCGMYKTHTPEGA